MRIHITARRLKLTDPIRSYVEEKIQKAQKYFDRITRVQVILSVEKRSHQAEIVAHAPKHTFSALAEGSDLYAAIDLASDKLDQQLKKFKEKLKDHHLISPEEGAVEPASVLSEGRRFSVVKQVPVRPISREDAAEEMESIGHNFWMFLDKDTKQVQVIFRRQDDSYGILKPVKWTGK